MSIIALKVALFEARKQHIGTKDFNKLPNFKDEYDVANSMFKTNTQEILDFRQEFYSYANWIVCNIWILEVIG